MSFFNIFNKPKPEPSPPPPQPTILVVEDEQYLSDFYRELLTDEGYKIITAANGQEGLDAILKNKPDLILMDIMMPLMDGNQVLEKLRQNNETKDTPVIVLTNAGNINNMDQAKQYSVYKFFIKSNIAPEELISTVKNALASQPNP